MISLSVPFRFCPFQFTFCYSFLSRHHSYFPPFFCRLCLVSLLSPSLSSSESPLFLFFPILSFQSINQSCIFWVVQVMKSLQEPLEVGNNLTGINDNAREWGLKCWRTVDRDGADIFSLLLLFSLCLGVQLIIVECNNNNNNNNNKRICIAP